MRFYSTLSGTLAPINGLKERWGNIALVLCTPQTHLKGKDTTCVYYSITFQGLCPLRTWKHHKMEWSIAHSKKQHLHLVCLKMMRNGMHVCLKHHSYVCQNNFVSLRHSVNGDFCGHSRFVLWHENLTTFVSWTLDSCQIWILGGGGGVCLNPFQELALIFSWRVGLNLSGGGVCLNPFQDLALIFSWRVGLNLLGGGVHLNPFQDLALIFSWRSGVC